MDPAELLSGLSRPEAFPEGGPTVEVVQTHISIVFLTGARAYKVKKTLSLWGLLDYSTVEARRALCEAEVRLNRRLAPEIYLGVLPVVRRGGRLFVGEARGCEGEGGEEVVDHAVVMDRFLPGATLSERITAGIAGESDVRAIAALLRRFHAGSAGGAETVRIGAPPAFERIVRQNVAATAAAVGDVFPADVHGWLTRRFEALLSSTRAVRDRRAREGRIVDGHGDLRAEHCVLRPGGDASRADGWRVIDAIEFSAALRCIDPLSDAAFLAMDLASLGRRDLERAFTDAILEPGADADARALWPLFLATRAHVRAKVDAHRATEAEIPAPARAAARASAQRQLALACGFLREGPPQLVVVAGLSGGGKSTVARTISISLRADVLSSDLVRKELAGLVPTERPSGEALARLYGAELTARTYQELLARAEASLRSGSAAVIDATCLRRTQREAFRAAARALGVPFVGVWVDVPDEVARERIEARARAGIDPSDATFEVRRAQRAGAEPPDAVEPDVLRHDGREPPEAALLAVAGRLARGG